MYSDSLIIINLNDNSISGYIDLRRSSESIVVAEIKHMWQAGWEAMR